MAVPELPEVAALVASLDKRAAGLVVTRVDVSAINVLKTYDPPVQALVGATVLGVRRAGKHIVIDVADVHGQPLSLVAHLSRAGWVRWRDDVPSGPAGLRRTPARGAGAGLALRIVFADGDGQPAGGIELTEAGTSKRLAVHLVADPEQLPGIATLGPDPLSADFDEDALAEVLQAAGRSQIKGVLRDQSRIAGIGNAYSDEILHLARISPFAHAATLPAAGRAALFQAIKSSLAQAVAVAGQTDPTSLKAEKKANMRVHGRTGLLCPECGDQIREVSFADSSLQYCPTCQTHGKVLADRRMSRLLK